MYNGHPLTEKQGEVSTWTSCYNASWQGLITSSSFCHPAKFSRSLIQRIYQHAIDEGFLIPGMTCLDPFGGTGLGGMDAGLAGIQWIGIELEPRFCDLAHGFDCDGTVQEALLGTFTPALPASHEWFLTDGVDRWGPEGRGEPFARGFLTNTEADGWRDAHPEAFVTDVTLEEVTIPAIPAYVTFTWEVVTPARCGEKQAHEPHHVLGNLELWQRKYGHLPQWVAPICLQGDSRRLGEVLQEPCACVVASPPYVEGLGHHRGTEADKKEWQYKSIGSNDYGHTEGQLANLPPGSLDAAISSPPYATGLGKEHTYVDHAKRERDSHRRIMTEKGIADPYYGSDPAQLGNMAGGEIEAVVSSPPWENCTNGDARRFGGMDVSEKRIERQQGGDFRGLYGTSPGQLGNTEATTFWSAALQILTQTYAVLKPGGHAIFVVKSYCRDGKIVDFPGQWRALCEHVGFVTLHEHHAMLVETHTEMGLFGEPVVMARTARKSFFRRLYENAHPENAIDFEVVLCMQKAPSPTPLPPNDAWDQLPLIDGCVSSPPFASTDTKPTALGCGKGTRADGDGAGRNKGDYFYPTSPNNLGNLPTGSIDLTLSSPPYAGAGEVLGTHNGIDYSKSLTGGKRRTLAREASGLHYGTSAGQLGTMPAGTPPTVQGVSDG